MRGRPGSQLLAASPLNVPILRETGTPSGSWGVRRSRYSRAKWVTMVLVVTMLVTGSVNTVSKKMGYSTCARGIPGVHATSDASDGCPAGERKFQKPWSQSLVMFLGESCCIFVWLYQRRQPPSENSAELALNPKPTITWRSAAVCALPAACDVGGTTLSGIGLLFTTASVFQMLRGSIIIFTAILSRTFLKRKVHGYQWTGVAITVVGITLVGGSSYMVPQSKSEQSTANKQLLGNALVILSQTMSAFQMVVEEKYLKRLHLPAPLVVGCEGIIGALLMVCIVLPLVYHIPFGSCDGSWCLDGGGIHEDALDAATLLSHSWELGILVLMYWVSIAFYNFCGLAVAKRLSSVHRTLIDACRTIVVWAVDLVLYYSTKEKYGEKWNTKVCSLRLVGFGIMIVGTLVHNKVIRLPCFFYGDEGSSTTPRVPAGRTSRVPHTMLTQPMPET